MFFITFQLSQALYKAPQIHNFKLVGFSHGMSWLSVDLFCFDYAGLRYANINLLETSGRDGLSSTIKILHYFTNKLVLPFRYADERYGDSYAQMRLRNPFRMSLQLSHNFTPEPSL